jgi:acetylornithine deacetylase/succinyl-diaminopimelate desuccinylase-like protein
MPARPAFLLLCATACASLALAVSRARAADLRDTVRAWRKSHEQANYDDNQHAENENLRLGNLWDGIEVYAGLVGDLNW